MTSGAASRDDAGEPAEPRSASSNVSERSRGVALALAVLGGVFGLHRFYTGRVQSGVIMCLTLGGMGMWYLYDVVVIAAGDFEDGTGRRVVRWDVAGEPGESTASERRVADVEDRLLSLESQVNELAERLDFAERLLAQARERGTLPKG
ncbi:MAG TPA: NINE protein [Gemmatimonadales bacterium]|nr:NINE protein [Gemmatimonadales bacterium]